MPAATRLTLSAALAAAVLAIAPAASRADADPPSDVLLTQSAYLPYQPKVPKALADALRSTLERAQQAKYPLKVAIVATPADLGAIPNLFNKPGAYAPFLARELPSANVPTLVVMPAGLGVANATPPAVSAIKGVSIDKSKNSDELVRAAIVAIPKLAKASGHPIAATPLPSETAKGRGGGTSPLLVFGAPVVLVALAALAVGLRRRRLGDDDNAPPSPPPA